ARPYGLIMRTGVSEDKDSWTAHVGPMGVFQNTLHDVDYDEVAGTAPSFDGRGGWLGFSDKYWLSALIAPGDRPVEAALRHGEGDRYQADVASQAKIVGPGESAAITTHLFAGAKEVRLLDDYSEAL